MAKHLKRAHTRKGKGKGKKSRSARRSMKQKKQSGGGCNPPCKAPLKCEYNECMIVDPR